MSTTRTFDPTMSRYHGICSFPHGTRATLGFMIICAAAWAATCYSVASCHYVTVSFVSYRGNVFSAPLQAASNTAVSYRVAAGLFAWANNNHNSCLAYTTYQLERGVLADAYLQSARIFSIFSVLGGLGVLLWSLLMLCMSLGRHQCRLFSVCLVLLVIFTGLTQLITRSSLCHSIGDPTHCRLNNGGLVAIAATLLWFVALVLAMVYVQSPNHDVIVDRNGVETNLFQKRQERRQAQKEARREEQQRRQLEKLQRDQQLQEEREQAEHLTNRGDDDDADNDDDDDDGGDDNRGRARARGRRRTTAADNDDDDKNDDTNHFEKTNETSPPSLLSRMRSPLKCKVADDDSGELEVSLQEPEAPLPPDHRV